MSARERKGWLLGIGLLALAAQLFRMSRDEAAHQWVPARVPLSWDYRHTVTVKFTATDFVQYAIDLDLERKLPFPQLDALVNGLRTDPHGVHGPASQPELAWSVRSRGREVPLETLSGSYWGETVGRSLVVFDAEPEQQFEVRVEVKRPAPQLQFLKPRVLVQAFNVHYPIYWFASDLYANLGLAHTFLGLGVVAVMAFRRVWLSGRPGGEHVRQAR